MNSLEVDCTEDIGWRNAQTDRLLAFEVLWRTFTVKQDKEMKPGLLADKVGIDRHGMHRITKGIRNAVRN